MALEQFGKLEEIRDADGQIAKPASDERLNKLTRSLPGLTTFDLDPGTGGSTLPSQTVPDGVTALVKANGSNGSPVDIGAAGGTHAFPLAPGEGVELNVENTDAIGATARSSGDTISVIVEV